MCEKAIGIAPTQIEGYEGLVGVYHAQDDVEKELELHYTIAEKIKEKAPDAYAFISSIYTKQGKHDEAIKMCEKAIKIAPTQIEGYAGLLRVYRAQEDVEKELEVLYTIAERFKEKAPEAYASISLIYTKQGKLDEAIKMCEKAIEIAPTQIEGYAGLLGVYRAQDDVEKELEVHYTIAEKFKEKLPEAYVFISLIYTKLGNHDEAIKMCEKAIEINENYANAWYNRACVYSLKGDKQKALSDLKQAIELDKKYKEMAKSDEDVKALWDDTEFKKLVE